MQQSDFLELVFGDQQGYVVTQPRAAHHGNWRKWPSAFTTDDQYFSPIVYSGEQRTKDDTAATSLVIYVDADRTDLDEFFTWTPSIRVTTSEGSHHLYWVLDAPVPMKDAASLSQRIGRAHKMEPSAGIAAKLLRLPGTLNTSSEKIQGSDAFPVTAESTGLIYSYAELSAGYPADDHEGQDLVRPDLGMPDTWPNHFDVLDRVDGESRLNLLLEAEFNTEDIDWSNKRYEALNLALEDGFSPAEATVLVWNSPLSDSKREHGIEHVWKYDTSKAVANQAAKDDPTLALPVEAPTDMPPLLTESERAYAAQQVTFVDRWVENAFKSLHAKTPPQYLVINALVLYSSVLSPHFAGRRPEGKKQLLNLYVMLIAGQNSGKTEALDEMLSYIRAYDETTGSQIDTGSSFTSSGLTKALKDKHNQASLIHTDEFKGIVNQWSNASGPYADAREMILRLYTGWLPKQLLATKDAGNTANVFVYLNSYFMGTPDTFEVMTRAMLSDGFTARMIPVLGKAAPQTIDDVRPIEGDEDEEYSTEIKSDITEWVIAVQRLIRWGQVATAEHSYRVRFTDDAAQRYTDFAWAIQQQAQSHKDPEVALPHARRLPINIWKVSAIHAIERYSDRIEMSDVLAAIAYGEQWWAWTLEIIASVSANEYTRRIEDVHRWLIIHGPKVRSATAFNKSPLSTLQNKEALDVLGGMAVRGILKKPWAQGDPYIELAVKN